MSRICFAAALAAALALALCGCGDPANPSGAPARYARTHTVTVAFGTAEDTASMCRLLGAGSDAIGCYRQTGVERLTGKPGTIYAPAPGEVDAVRFACIMDHELAHVGGMPPDHDGLSLRC